MIEPGRQLTDEERAKRAEENRIMTENAYKRANELRGQDIVEGRERPLMADLTESIKSRIEGGEVMISEKDPIDSLENGALQPGEQWKSS